MNTSGMAVIGLALIAVTACGSRASTIDQTDAPVGARWNATLATPGGLAGAVQVQGMGWMGRGEEPGETEAYARITNATPGGKHPWHIHRGRCGTNGPIVGSISAYEPLEVGGDGTADESATLDMVLPTGGEYYVNIHASPTNLSTIISCGNLAPPSR